MTEIECLDCKSGAGEEWNVYLCPRHAETGNLEEEVRRLRAELEQAMVVLRGMDVDAQQDRGLLALGKRLIELEQQLAEANAARERAQALIPRMRKVGEAFALYWAEQLEQALKGDEQ